MDANGTHHVKRNKLDSERFISSTDIHTYIHTYKTMPYMWHESGKGILLKGGRRQKRMMGCVRAKPVMYMHQDVLQKLNKNMDTNNLEEDLKPYKINI